MTSYQEIENGLKKKKKDLNKAKAKADEQKNESMHI